MVDIGLLSPGMKIKIVDQWVPGCKEDSGGRMDYWLGQIVTVRTILHESIHIEEDRGEFLGNGWYWCPAAIDCIVQDEDPFQNDHDFSPAADLDFFSILPGRQTKQIQRKEERT